MVESDRSVEIDYVAIAGRHGWSTVRAKFLDRDLCTIVILSSGGVKNVLNRSFITINSLRAFLPCQKTKSWLVQRSQNIKIEIYRYHHLPNFIGFLVNGNYLFTAMSYWEMQENEPANLRGGGTDYLVYDKNDGFGGAFFVKRFAGWFSYAARAENKVPWMVEKQP